MHWPTRLAILIAVGTLVVAGIVVARARHGGTAVYALVETANGAQGGQTVSYLGVDIGRVEGVGFARDGVLLRLVLDPSRGAPVRRGDTVRMVPSGFFGDRTVRIVPGDPSLPLVAAGDTLRGAVGEAAREAAAAAVMEGFAKALMDSMGRIHRTPVRDSTPRGVAPSPDTIARTTPAP